MNLKYKIIEGDFFYENGYCINFRSVAYYAYWIIKLPIGIYKYEFFGLRFWGSFRKVTNQPLGIKIEY